MRSSLKIATTLLASMAGLPGCSLPGMGLGNGPQPLPAIGDSTWSAKNVEGTMTAATAPIHIHFDGVGRILGFSGCNAFTADYLSRDRSLEISRIRPESANVCARDVSAQESRLFETLPRVRWIRREEDGTLLLRTGRGKVPLRLVPDSKL